MTITRAVGNSTSVAKDVRNHFVHYVNNLNHELSWQNIVIRK